MKRKRVYTDEPDPMDMLDVIEESRQDAMARREAAVEHMGTMALEALLNGEDPREIARKCGFNVERKPGVTVNTVDPLTGRLMSDFRSIFDPSYGTPKHTAEQRFAHWLGKRVTDLILEKMGEEKVVPTPGLWGSDNDD